MKIKLLVFSVVCLLAACATKVQTIPIESNIYTEPSVGTGNIKEIGETLISKGKVATADGYRLTSVPVFRMSGLPYPHKEGTTLPLAGETKESYLYFVPEGHNHKNTHYIAGILRSKKNPDWIVPFTNSVNGLSNRRVEGFQFEPSTYKLVSETYVKKEFIYNGKVGNSLRFIYREYVGDLARPSFMQELQYDLSDGNFIGFKGLRLEVINTTNTNIEYKLIKDFD